MGLAEVDGGQLLAGGVLEGDLGGRGDRAAVGDLSDLELLQLEDVLADLRDVGGIAVERLHDPALVRGGEGERLSAAYVDARDGRGVEGGQDLLADDGRRLHRLLRVKVVGRAAEDGRHAYKDYKIFRCHFSLPVDC